MQTIYRKFQVGDRAKKRGITILIEQVLGYYETQDAHNEKNNQYLKKLLGDDYRAVYFEVLGMVTRASAKCEYKVGDSISLDFFEIQKYAKLY